MADETTPLTQAYRAYEQFEGQLSTALDQLVTTNGFADLLATSATNVMAMTRLVNGAIDRAVRSTRLAGRQDVTELARQLARTEDKLERLLQAVQELQDRLDSAASADAAGAAEEGEVSSAPPAGAPGARTAARNGRSARPRATAATTRQPAAAEEPS